MSVISDPKISFFDSGFAGIAGFGLNRGDVRCQLSQAPEAFPTGVFMVSPSHDTPGVKRRKSILVTEALTCLF